MFCFSFYSGSGVNDSSSQHVYSINTDTLEDKCLTCDMLTPEGLCSYASASVSKDQRYITMICQGPGPNYVIIHSLENVSN